MPTQPLNADVSTRVNARWRSSTRRSVRMRLLYASLNPVVYILYLNLSYEGETDTGPCGKCLAAESWELVLLNKLIQVMWKFTAVWATTNWATRFGQLGDTSLLL